MLKNLIKVANELDEAGIKWAADAIDGVITALASDQPDWILDPMIRTSDNVLAAEIGTSEIENANVKAGLTRAILNAKAKLRSSVKSGEEYIATVLDEHYEPDMIDPKKVWVRVAAERDDQGAQR